LTFSSLRTITENVKEWPVTALSAPLLPLLLFPDPTQPCPWPAVVAYPCRAWKARAPTFPNESAITFFLSFSAIEISNLHKMDSRSHYPASMIYQSALDIGVHHNGPEHCFCFLGRGFFFTIPCYCYFLGRFPSLFKLGIFKNNKFFFLGLCILKIKAALNGS
jgi:hypothetical protein